MDVLIVLKVNCIVGLGSRIGIETDVQSVLVDLIAVTIFERFDEAGELTASIECADDVFSRRHE